MSARWVVFLVVVALASANLAAAQVRLAEVSGTVTDESAALLEGVTITVTEATTGQKRSTLTGSRGNYLVTTLPVGVYDVRAEREGFGAVVIEKIQLGIGENVRLDIRMKVADVSETIVVKAEPPLIDPTTSDLAGKIGQAQIEELPLSGRHWMFLAGLAPGIKAVDRGGGRDAGSEPTAGIGDYRMTKVFVDGAPVQNSANPHVEMQLSKEVLAEFEVVANRFDAVMGHAGTVIVNAVTKSGTDHVRGSAFFYWRDDSLNAKDFFTGRVEPYSERQYGGTFGFPVFKGRTHTFLSYERQVESETLSANTAIPSLDAPADSTDTRNLYFGRFDHSLTPNHRLQLRANRFDRLQPNAGIGGARTVAHANTWEVKIHRYDVGVNSVFGNRFTNQFLGTYMDTVKRGTHVAGPHLVHLFPTLNLPPKSMGVEHPFYWFARNDSSYVFEKGGQHSLKFGGEYQHVTLHSWNGATAQGIFFYDQDPQNIATCCAGPDPSKWDRSQFPAPVAFLQTLGDLAVSAPNDIYSAYLQDDWKMSQYLTFNLGMRYDLEVGSLAHDATGLAVERHKNDTDNLQPRLGFVWDVKGTGKTLVRGGGGLYYDQFWLNVALGQRRTNSGRQLRVQRINPTRDPNFANDPLGGRTFDDFKRLGGADVVVIPAEAEQPHVWTWSIGLARQLTQDLAISADYVNQRSDSMIRSFDSNLFCCMADGNAWPIGSGVYPELGGFVQGRGRPDPRFNQIRNDTADGRSRYHGLQVALNKRMRKNYQFGMSYLLSKNMADHSGLGSFPNNQFNPADEYSRAVQDQRHLFVANWVSHLPYGIGFSGIVSMGSPRPIFTLLGGVSGGLTGSVDINGDRVFSGDRPTCGKDPRWTRGCTALGIPNGQRIPRNPLTTGSFFKVDVRLSKRIHIARTDVDFGIEAFNLFNRKNFDPTLYNDVLSSPQFGQPGRSDALPYVPRQIQLGARVAF